MGNKEWWTEKCPNCGEMTLEHFEQLTSNLKSEDCANCGYTVPWLVDDSKNPITITSGKPYIRQAKGNDLRFDGPEAKKKAMITSPNQTSPDKETREAVRELLFVDGASNPDYTAGKIMALLATSNNKLIQSIEDKLNTYKLGLDKSDLTADYWFAYGNNSAIKIAKAILESMKEQE